MKKIAILAPYVGTVNRGAETFVIELVRKLSLHYDIDVYSLAQEEKIKDNVILVKVKKSLGLLAYEKIYNKSRIIRKIVNRFYYLIPEVIFQRKFTKSAFKIIDEKIYDILFPNNGVWGAKYSSKYRARHNTPYIYTGHGGIGTGEKIIIENNPNAYICLTQKHLDWANNVKTECVITSIIPNGVNVNDFHSREENISDNKLILSVGALTAFKRHELTIEAVSKMKKNVKLIILGKGEEEESLKALASKILPNRCMITSTSYSNVKDFYRKADLFVLPSVEEPFGIVYLEALSSNVPIVAPDDSQRREIIANAGLYCDVKNADVYARTMDKAMAINWANIPIDRAKIFDWNIISKKYAELIEMTISKY